MIVHGNATDVIAKTPLYKSIQKLSPEKRGLHDIHLKFQVSDIWTIIASSKKYIPNDVSKAISLPCIITSNHLGKRTLTPTNPTDVRNGKLKTEGIMIAETAVNQYSSTKANPKVTNSFH